MADTVRIAYCGGTWDLMHPGHVRFFEWVFYNFDRVVVSVNRDEFAARYKQPPIQCLAERMEMVEACRYVDEVIINSGDEDSTVAIEKVKPTHIVNGSDWSKEKLMEQMGLTEEFLKDNGIEVIICPLPRHFSSTELKNRVRTQK